MFCGNQIKLKKTPVKAQHVLNTHMIMDRIQTSQPGQRHCDPAYIKLRMPARGAEVSAPVRTFVEEKTVSQNFWKVFVARFSEISDETNQGDGEMASIDGGLIRDLRFDSFQ